MSAVGYAVIIEKGPTSYGAYVPDLPGCVAVGSTHTPEMLAAHGAPPDHMVGDFEEYLAGPGRWML